MFSVSGEIHRYLSWIYNKGVILVVHALETFCYLLDSCLLMSNLIVHPVSKLLPEMFHHDTLDSIYLVSYG